MEQEKSMKCVQCQCELDLGVNVYGAQEGVIGNRGFVPLEEISLFCCVECLRDNFGKIDITKLSRRIP